jgi:hypothetical protein
MKKEEEIALKVTKEIVVKFIEVGRLSVNSFKEVWDQVYSAVIKSADPEKTKSTKKQG